MPGKWRPDRTCEHPNCLQERLVGDYRYCERHESDLEDQRARLDAKYGSDLSKKGYIYFIRAGCDPFIKIGLSVNVKTRLAEIQVGNHRELALLTSIAVNDFYEVESLVHKVFARDRGCGEWFKESPQLLRVIEVAKTGDLDEFYRTLYLMSLEIKAA